MKPFPTDSRFSVLTMKAPRRKSAKGGNFTPSPSSSCLISNLPHSILIEILCSVPIKTLAACKSVCKSWLRLITDPQFPQLHQPKSPTEVCFQFYYDANTTKLYMGNFNFLTNFDPLDVKLDTLFEFPKFSVKPNNALDSRYLSGQHYFANSCNGLLCYYGESKNRFAVIWNPCTSEFITFPAPKIHKGVFMCWGYWLGFSRKVEKYKLLRVMSPSGTVSSAEVQVAAEICTIEKTCSWKTVGPCSPAAWKHIISSRKKTMLYGTFLQGTLHWVGSSDTSKSDVTIHTFDFEDDKFGRLPLPSGFGQTYRNSYPLEGEDEERLGVLAGCLSITEYTDVGVNIWLMKEYGVQASWTNLLSLGFTIDTGLDSRYCLPISYMDNGEILMKCTDSISTTVFFYNPVLKSVRDIGSGRSSFRVIAYRPSLVMLKDSMLGYKVHVKPKCADFKQGKKFTAPVWWTPVMESEQHQSKAPLRNFFELI